MEGQWYGPQCVSSELHAADLNYESEDEDDEEEGVVEEVLEDIDFVGLEFAGVDFVEDLHEDEGVEKEAVVFARLNGPLLDSNGGLDAEQCGS